MIICVQSFFLLQSKCDVTAREGAASLLHVTAREGCRFLSQSHQSRRARGRWLPGCRHSQPSGYVRMPRERAEGWRVCLGGHLTLAACSRSPARMEASRWISRRSRQV
jgi:hypothetical protein